MLSIVTDFRSCGKGFFTLDLEQYNKDIKIIEEKLSLLPWYVAEFIEYACAELGITLKTAINYLHDYLVFFTWITVNNYSNGTTKEVPLSVLDSFGVDDIDSFLLHCIDYRQNKNDTLARKTFALASLFDYLASQAEHAETYKSYLTQNIMSKVKKEKVTTPDIRIEKLEDRIFYTEEEFRDFRAFVSEGYKELVKEDKRRLLPYLQNRERDIAIISLIFGSGIRLSEVVGIDVGEINLQDRCLFTIRRRGKVDNVICSKMALDDVNDYLEVRTQKYNVPKDFKPLFISANRGGHGLQRLGRRSVQAMIERYAKAYGKPGLTVHKLRHSFAVQNYNENRDLLWLQKQLGHSDLTATSLYAHIAKKCKQEKEKINSKL